MSKRKNVMVLLSVLMLASMVLSVMPAFAQDAPIDVRMWIAFTDRRLDWAREKAGEFNAAFPQYNVIVEGYDNYEDLFAATALAAEQGNLPEIVQYFEVATQTARDSGYFKSIAEAIGDRTEINGVPVDFSDIIPVVSSYYTLDGQWTSMPWNSSSAIMYTNMELLAAAGLENPPATWQELEAACEAIMALEDGPEGCITWPNYGWFFEQWMAAAGAPIANNDNGRSARADEVLLDSDAAVRIASWWQDMYNKGYYIYSGVQRDWNGTEQAFQSQQVAFILTSSADAGNITNAAADNGITVKTTRYPYDEETGWNGNLIGGASLWLADGLTPEVEDAALTFLLWFTNTENAARWHQLTGYLPIRTSAAELLESEGWFADSPNFATAGDQLSNTPVSVATAGGLFGDFPAIRNVMTQAFEDLMLTGGDPAERMAQAKADADVILSEYNLLYGEE